MSSGRDAVSKEYATDEIVVEWEPRLYFHSENCCGGSQNKPFCDGTHKTNGFCG
jgi:CDGSH-type Zn-finger protein